LIFSPSITTTTFFRNESPRPSNKLPQCKAIVLPELCPSAAEPTKKKMKPKAKVRITLQSRSLVLRTEYRVLSTVSAFPVRPLWIFRRPLYQISLASRSRPKNAHAGAPHPVCLNAHPAVNIRADPCLHFSSLAPKILN